MVTGANELTPPAPSTPARQKAITAKDRASAEHAAHERALSLYSIVYIVFFVMIIAGPNFWKATIVALPMDVSATRLFAVFSDPSNSPLQAACFLYICLCSNFRFLFGSLFADRDSTFKEALRKIYSTKDGYEDTLVYVYTTVKILMVISIIRTYLFFVYEGWVFVYIACILMFMESMIILFFDIKFWNVLTKVDKNARSNKWIIGVDLFYVVVCILFCLIVPVFNSLFEIFRGSSIYTENFVIVSIAGAFALVTACEFFASYTESFSDAWSDTIHCLKVRFSRSFHPF